MNPSGKMPVHVGVIMDGNGRWAQLRGLPRIEGHRVGAERAKEIIEAASEFGIRYLTLYTFSAENWQRPETEVSMLMKLLELYLRREFAGLMEKGIVYRAIGDISRLPSGIFELVRETEKKTAGNHGMTLITALSYGGRSEIINAVKKIIRDGVNAEDVTEDRFSRCLDTCDIPDPDLVIRTSGERRLSNFLLWQSAYSELYFTETHWPDFGREEFLSAIRDYQGRERRFGGIPLQSNAS